MIQCNTCEEWYHVDCLKLNKTSLNKIKNLRCPTCSLCHNSSFKRLVLEHQSERATYEEFAELVHQINIIKAHVQLGNQELDILDYHRTYTLIRHQSVEHIKELEGYLESGEAGFEQEFFRDRMDNILIPNLQNSLKMLLGLPFYCEDILHIVLILRKQKLYSTIFNAKCAKKLHPLDLMAIENLAVDIEIGSQPMEQFVQFAQLALKKLSTIEEAEMKRLPYEEFKRVFDEHCSPIKDIGIVDRQQLALEEWPAYRDHLKAKMESLKNLTVKFYQEETHNLAAAFPFTSELEELIRKRYELVNDWKIKVKHQLGQQTLNRAYLATLQEQVQGILSPSEGDLSNLNTYLQFNTANNLQQPAAN